MRLMPQPPALEDSRNTNWPSSVLNCCTILARFFSVVVPSSRSAGYCISHRQVSEDYRPLHSTHIFHPKSLEPTEPKRLQKRLQLVISIP